MSDSENEEVQIGRNEPCPCGSGKKYKRCCGAGAAPKLGRPKEADSPSLPGVPGFDPAQMDPTMVAEMQKAMSRLPRSQVQRLQKVMMKAMAGKDVSKEMASIQGSLPPGFLQMMNQMQIPGMDAETPSTSEEMNADQAKEVVAQAVERGELTEEQAKELLGGEVPKKKGAFSKLMGRFRKKD